MSAERQSRPDPPLTAAGQVSRLLEEGQPRRCVRLRTAAGRRQCVRTAAATAATVEHCIAVRGRQHWCIGRHAGHEAIGDGKVSEILKSNMG